MMLENIRIFIANSNLLLFGLIFVSSSLLAIVVLNVIGGAIDLGRRTSSAAASAGSGAQGATPSSVKTVFRSSENAGKGISALLLADPARRSELRKFLELAGFESQYALIFYQIVRIVAAIGLGFMTVIYSDTVFTDPSSVTIISVSLAFALLGFYLPKTLVSLRRDTIMEAHRDGFPDFLDLMVICADAGVGVESAIERVSRELSAAHPSLARNLHIMSLEMRAGRSRGDALAALAERLGIEEARSFATLLQQSEELGTSLVQALRVYSDEMRAKRYARAEEKAMGLPAKLVIPLGFCVFPVILAIVLVPVVMRIYGVLGI